MGTTAAPASWLRRLASLRLTTAILALVFLEVLAGTLIQTRSGLRESQRLVFENWIGGIPFLCLLGALNLGAAFGMRLRFAWRQAGLLLAHAGLLGLLLAGALGLWMSRTSEIDLGPGERAQAGVVADAWEIVAQVRTDSGISSRAVGLRGVGEGDVLDFGEPVGQARVAGFVSHGQLFVGGKPIALPGEDDPARRVPAIAIVLGEGAAARTIGLDGRQPMAAAGEGRVFLLQKREHALPFAIELLDFRRETHPGSTRPKSFESRVRVLGQGGSREAVIRMNHPLREAGFTLYQASWRTDERTGEERTILSVVENPVGSMPYWATLLIALGLALHFLPRLRPSARATRGAPPLGASVGGDASVPSRSPVAGAGLIILLLALSAVPVAASPARPDAPALPPVPADLAALPVQLDGRVRTFETFAAHTLLQIAGKSSLPGLDAPRWLAAVLLDPASVRDIPVFLVEHPDARDALGLRGQDRDRYSWAAVETCGVQLEALAAQAAAKENEERDALDREFLRLSDAWYRLHGLVEAFAFLRPGSTHPFAHGEAPAARFVDLALRADAFAARLDSLSRLAADSLSVRDSATLAWFRTVFQQSADWSQAEFPVVPYRDSIAAPWASPAELVVAYGLAAPGLRRTVLDWDTLRTAWTSGDTVLAARAAHSLRDSLLARAGAGVRLCSLRAESLYNRVQPFRWAMVLFGVALLPALAGVWRRSAWLSRSSVALSLAGLAFVGAGMALRMVVTRRPPVTNLYETFLFVAFVTVPVLLVAGRLRAWPVGRALAAASGLLLLVVARAFGADGDTMPVLVAVLDSNFWLTVHVLTITVGYGGVVAAGIAAHWHLVQLRARPASPGDTASRDSGAPRLSASPSDGRDASATTRREDGAVVRDLLAFGLFFTFIGTLLGGVWADQSWGRFWGWDPKENGALLIVLWCAILFHARRAGQIGLWGFSLGAALSIATVLFAWFGVNLLGVGLHSYGFTQGTMWGLAAYAAAEAVFVGWAWQGRK